jgi:hypothetical protein
MVGKKREDEDRAWRRVEGRRATENGESTYISCASISSSLNLLSGFSLSFALTKPASSLAHPLFERADNSHIRLRTSFFLIPSFHSLLFFSTNPFAIAFES